MDPQDRAMLVLLLGASFVAFGCGPRSQDSTAPASQWSSFTDDGAWCWFSDPRAIYHRGEKEQTYAAWVTSAGDIMIGAYDHARGEIRTAVLHEKLERDDHDVPSILVRDDGRLMAFYSRHSKDDFYLRVSENPEDVSQWRPAQRLTMNDNDEYPADFRRAYCYSNPFQLSRENGRIFLFWRGIGNKPCLSISEDGGQTWSKGKIVVFPRETYKNQRPYVKYATNFRDRIHLAFTDGHPRNEPTNGIYYACYRNGAFYRADGSKITDLDSIPFGPRDADVVYDARLTNVRAWVWDVAGDENDDPAIVYTRLPAETDHRYHYARWDGTQWQDHEITAAGKWFPQTQRGKTEREPHYSAGVVLDHSNPSVVYLSRPVNGVFEIEKWTTPDSGKSWDAEAVTTNSKYDNVRPFVPWNSRPGNGPQVLWMSNRRYVHYTDFQTAIKMDVPAKK